MVVDDNGRNLADVLVARMGADAFIGIVERHEREEHGGERCSDERAGIAAFVAHAVGLRLDEVELFKDALSRYAEHHHDEHGRSL